MHFIGAISHDLYTNPKREVWSVLILVVTMGYKVAVNNSEGEQSVNTTPLLL